MTQHGAVSDTCTSAGVVRTDTNFQNLSGSGVEPISDSSTPEVVTVSVSHLGPALGPPLGPPLTSPPPSGVEPISASSKGAMDSEDHASALDLSESVTVQYSLLSYCLTLYTRIYMAIAVLEMTASHWPFSEQVANLTDHSAACSATVA